MHRIAFCLIALSFMASATAALADDGDAPAPKMKFHVPAPFDRITWDDTPNKGDLFGDDDDDDGDDDGDDDDGKTVLKWNSPFKK
jgi:hypothetical protein